MTGRRACCRPISNMARRRGVKTVMTVHNIAFKGFFGSEIFTAAAAAAAGVRGRRRRILWRHLLSQVGPGMRRLRHHGQPQLCRRNPHARIRHGAGRACSTAGPIRSPAFSTASTPIAWDPAIDPALAQNFSASTVHMRARQQGGAGREVRARWRRRAAVLRGQPADRPEGHGPAAAGGRWAGGAGRRGWWCWVRARPYLEDGFRARLVAPSRQGRDHHRL